MAPPSESTAWSMSFCTRSRAISRYALRWVRSAWNKFWRHMSFGILQFLSLELFVWFHYVFFHPSADKFPQYGPGNLWWGWPVLMTSRLFGSSETGLTPSTKAGTVVEVAPVDSSRGTGWSAGAGWSIWPEGRHVFPTWWVTSRSSMEIRGLASSWRWQHVTPWYQCPLGCFQGP